MALRVFLVEDLHTLRALLADLFDSLGGLEIVGSAETEAEANLWLAENPSAWDVVIVDLVLQEGSGLGVLSRLRQLPHRGKAVVVFSGYASPGIRAHCMKLGADAVFHKAETEPFVKWLQEEASRQGG